jgi:cell division protein FtsL
METVPNVLAKMVKQIVKRFVPFKLVHMDIFYCIILEALNAVNVYQHQPRKRQPAQL